MCVCVQKLGDEQHAVNSPVSAADFQGSFPIITAKLYCNNRPIGVTNSLEVQTMGGYKNCKHACITFENYTRIADYIRRSDYSNYLENYTIVIVETVRGHHRKY
jgi:hypothetical protein